MRWIVFKALVWKREVFCIVTESGSFWKKLSRKKFDAITSHKVSLKKWLSRSPLRNSGQLFPIKQLSISVFIGDLIKLVIIEKVFSKISKCSQENTCVRVSFLIKLQAWGLQIYLKRLCHRCFPLNFTKFSRTSFLQNTSGRLLLKDKTITTLTSKPGH